MNAHDWVVSNKRVAPRTDHKPVTVTTGPEMRPGVGRGDGNVLQMRHETLTPTFTGHLKHTVYLVYVNEHQGKTKCGHMVTVTATQQQQKLFCTPFVPVI